MAATVGLREGPGTSPRAGFQGAIESLPLVDLLQVWSLNRFSGLVSVSSEGRTAQIFLVEGEVVHAEADEATGEAAVRAVVSWLDGSFELSNHPEGGLLARIRLPTHLPAVAVR